MAPTNLQIKVNALNRLLKEKKLYESEISEQKSLVNKMISDKSDEYELKKQQQVLDESERMAKVLDETIIKHGAALKTFVETYEGDENLSAARELIKTVI